MPLIESEYDPNAILTAATQKRQEHARQQREPNILTSLLGRAWKKIMTHPSAEAARARAEAQAAANMQLFRERDAAKLNLLRMLGVVDPPHVPSRRPTTRAELPAPGGIEEVPLFDPEGVGFDYETAREAGVTRDPTTGHFPSLDPRTGMVLKGRAHSSWDDMVAAEEQLGNSIIKREDGRYYSIDPTQPRPTWRVSRINLTEDGGVTATISPDLAGQFSRIYQGELAKNGGNVKLALRSAMLQMDALPSNFGEIVDLLVPDEGEKEVMFWTEARALSQNYTQQGMAPNMADIAAMSVVAKTLGFAPEEAQRLIYPGVAEGEYEAEATRAEAAAVGRETAQQRIWEREQAAPGAVAGPLGREIAAEKIRREELPKLLTPEIVKGLGEIKAYTQTIQDIEALMEKGDIPTGPGEVLRKKLDDWGLWPDKARIALRTLVARLPGLMYAMRGKQLSDKELEVALNMMPKMEQAPVAFMISLRNFADYMNMVLETKIEAFGAAGYDVERLGEISGVSAAGPQVETEYIIGRTYTDRRGRRAKYLGIDEETGKHKWDTIEETK